MTLSLPDWSVVVPKRVEHIARVAALADAWAVARGTAPSERARWRRAALLHDALRDAEPAGLARWVPRGDWPEALWHGPAAAAAAAAAGETDRGVLDAVTYHSVGYAAWDDCGRILFLADYLEPGRPYARERRAALAARVPTALEAVLREVTAWRVEWLLTNGRRIRRETWEWWNSLAGGA